MADSPHIANVTQSSFDELVVPFLRSGNQTVAEKARIAADVERNVLPLLESGRVRPIIHQTFPLDAAAAAHELMESSRHMGKIVLNLREAAS